MRRLLGLGLLGLAMLAGCGDPTVIGSDWHRIQPPRAAPRFSLPQLEGGTAQLADYHGQVVIMEFWATWCQPCRFSLPSLEKIYREYRDRGVVVLLINEEEEPDAIRRWAARRYAAPMLLDRDGLVATQYRIDGIPALFIIDQAGQLVYTHGGYGGGLERNLRLILNQLLGPSSSASATDAGHAANP